MCNLRELFIGIVTVFTFFIGVSQNTYYVSTSGNNSNDGKTTATSWRTISYAASTASAVTSGDKVFIKAGNYGNENIIFQKDGTANLPITFEGYKTTPEDNPNLNWKYGDDLNASIMPLIDGGDRTKGIGIDLQGKKYININNIQIKNYEYGMFGYNAHHITITNVIAMYFGDVNAEYNGKGLVFGSLANDITLNNCVVYNSCAEGISIVGDNSLINNCKVYADDNSTGNKSAMDYYIHISGNNNVVENCYVERLNNIEHSGHAIGLKGNCENNIVRNCIAKGFEYYGFNVRHAGSKNNLFENCTAINCGFTIREGSYNTFKNCKTIDADYAVMFWDTHDNDNENAGHHNVFENCIFQNTKQDVITFHYFAYPSSSNDNVFMNCVFYGGKNLFVSDRENSNNKMVNCIVTNIQNYSKTQVHQDIAYPVNFNYEYTNFYNNGFETPSGINITTFNPNYSDLETNDFHLKSSSLCIDAGTAVNAPSKDFDGIDRPQGNGIDLGPFEYTAVLGNIEYKKDDVLVYPNPASITITIKSNQIELTDIRIYNSLGQKIIDLPINETSTRVIINLNSLKKGIYFIKTKTNTFKVYKI